MSGMKKFQITREPALLITLLATIVRVLVAHFVVTTPAAQTWVNAVVTAAGGLVVAVWVKHNGQVPAILGFVQAVLALAVGFGFALSPGEQAAIMSIVGGLAALFVRQHVIAPGGSEAHVDTLG